MMRSYGIENLSVRLGLVDAARSADPMAPDAEDDIKTIRTGAAGMHDALVRSAARMAPSGLPQPFALSLLRGLAPASTERERDRGAKIPRIVASAYEKFYCAGLNADGSEPIDLFAGPESRPVFVAEDFPPSISGMAADVSRRIGCDALIPAMSALCVAGALIDDSVQLQVKRHDTGWTESARLWGAIVGPPSVKKTPGMNAVLQSMQAIESRLFGQYQREVQAWTRAQALAKRSGEAIVPPPTAKRISVSDTTTEALGPILADNPGGVLAVHDELSGWIGSLDAYRSSGASKDRAFWLSAYQGDAYKVDRKGSPSIHIPHLSVSILGGIQPGPMRRFATTLGDDGLLQRFIVITAADAQPGADVAPDRAALDAWSATAERLYESRGDSLFSMWPTRIRFAPDAQTLMDAARARVFRLSQSPALTTKQQSAMGKAEGQLARITLIFHCVEDSSGMNGEPSSEISATTAARAIRLFERLVLPSASHFYAEVVGVSEVQTTARRIAGSILVNAWETVTERDIYRDLRDLRTEAGREHLADSVRVLELAGWLQSVGETYRKGRATRWAVNPLVHARFAVVAERERPRRDAAREDFKSAVSRVSLTGASAEKQIGG